jgi:hypothetical protein
LIHCAMLWLAGLFVSLRSIDIFSRSASGKREVGAPDLFSS